MCGILGIAFLKGHTIEDPEIIKSLLKDLLIESRVRGSDATGVTFISESNISVKKLNISADLFVKADFYKKAEKLYIDGDHKSYGLNNLKVILGHTRAQTKGTHENRDNNHPIVSNRIIGVHNGYIGNDDQLFAEFTRSFPDTFRRKARVDTEIIFRLIDHYKNTLGKPMYEAIKITNEKITGGRACAFVNASSPWMLWLFKGAAPTNVSYFPKCGLIVFSSSQIFINRATAGLVLGRSIELDYDDDSCLSVNTISNKITTFDLEKNQTFFNQGAL